MVNGLEKWKEFFSGYLNNYVLIGGAACNVYEEEFAQTPRATKDLDVVLVVEALSAEFCVKFWEFIISGNYSSRQRGADKHEYYRFMNPDNDSFPKQIELFARSTGLLNIPREAHIEPIHVGDNISSLSAILMNDDYYDYTVKHSTVIDGLHLASVDSLVCLKAKAYLDLDEKRESGTHIDKRDIEKHKKDVLRLTGMLAGDSRFSLPIGIKNDLRCFCDKVGTSLPNNDFMKSVGLGNVSAKDLLVLLMEDFEL